MDSLQVASDRSEPKVEALQRFPWEPYERTNVTSLSLLL